MKKTKLFILIILFTLYSLVTAGAFIEYFTATSNGENIVLNWQTGRETNLQKFVILRGKDKNNLVELLDVVAKGDFSTYNFVDENAYKTSESFYVYQLKIVDKDGNVSYSGYASVTHNVSGVKRTWGSIKALFR